MSSDTPPADRASRPSLAVRAPDQLLTPAFAAHANSATANRFGTLPNGQANSDQDEGSGGWRAAVNSLLGSWLTSLVMHLFLLLVLTLITFGTAGSQLGLELSFNELDAASESIAVDFDLAVDESLLDAPAAELLASTEALLELVETETLVPLDPTETISHVDPFSSVNLLKTSGLPNSSSAEMAGSVSAGLGADGGSDSYGTRFFGLNSKGSRFVFVIDRSSSMADDYRWGKAVTELMRAITELDRKSEFLVLLYSGQTFIMFDTPPRKISLIRATKKNIDKLAKWLGRQSPGGVTMPAHAMSVGLAGNPDAIFLLSDGILMDNTRGMLRVMNSGRPVRSGGTRKIPIHTIAMDAGPEGSALLQWIAEENDGQYRSIR